MSQEVIEKVGEVIRLHQMSRNLTRIPRDDLKYFPINYLQQFATSIELSQIFTHLPISYQMDRNLQMKLPCVEHCQDDGDQWDGPPLARKYCRICVEKYK